MNCNTTHYRANSSSVPGDPTASIATKIALKGSAYYESRELLTDIVVGVVDAVVSAATAGLGGKLLKLRPLAKLAQSAKLAPRLLAHGLAEGAENFISAIPSAMAAQLMDKKREGLNFSEIFTAGAMGAALGGGLGMVGGLKKPVAKAAGQLAESADILARRGTPTERLAGWRLFQEANPGKSYKEFLADLDAGILARQADEEAVRQAQRNMRQELFTDIPHAQRAQFKDVPIHVMSDAEFESFTRSAKGQAVVVIEEGKPRVLLRESADPRVLREEGIHLLQSVDPKKAHLFRELDERVLSKWDQLPLDEQLSLYGKKLDLEIDGQQRLLKNLNEALAAAGDDAAARKQILAQIENAEHTLENLSRRVDDVAGITPQRRLDIAKGTVPKPDYLEQPARLFAKKAESPEFAKALKKAGIDLDEAKRVLDDAYARSGAKKELATTLEAVSEKFKSLDPPKAKAYLEDVLKVLDSRTDAGDHLAALVTLSANSNNPLAVMRSAKTLAGAGLEPTAQLSKRALGEVSQRLSSLKPDAAASLLTSVADVVDSYAKKPADLSGFIVSATKLKDPAAFLTKLKSFSEFVGEKVPPIPDGTLRYLGDHLAELTPRKAGAYFDALDDLLRAHPTDFELLNGFLIASTRSGNPSDYIGIVKELGARKASGALSQTSFEMLSRRAAGRGIDLEWLAKTNLFSANTPRANAILDFLAFDKNTPWNDFVVASQIKPNKIKAAWADAKLRKYLQSTSKAVRGFAGELVVMENAAGLLKSIGHDLETLLRQQTLTGTVSDFIAKLKNGISMGLEVKTHSQTFWRNFKRAEERITELMARGMSHADAYKALSAREKASYNAVWTMLKTQLPAAAAVPRLAPPALIISDVVGKIGGWGVIEKIIRAHLPPGTKIVIMSEAEIMAASREMRSLLGIP